MFDKIKKEKKWLFYILLPIVGLAWLVNLLMKYNVFGANRDLKNTKKQVEKINNQKEKINQEAQKIMKDVDENLKKVAQKDLDSKKAQKEISELQNKKIEEDENWHLKN